ncbi:phosphohydrolase [Deinococcus aerolatus]|uniref:Phosphohydrolase n=1 Tax=Deinococcus aerolatus TaxID=522487 RepID=A0ABQ2GBM8_9DEIO|nr:phosphohydrolase [Deinococcus aerolatus]
MGAGVAVLKEGQVLRIRRGDNGLWDVLSGDSESGETLQDTARRELAEETGLSVGVLRSLAVFQHPHTYPDGHVVEWEERVFTAEHPGGEVRAGDDALEAGWAPLNALPCIVSNATASDFAALRQSPPLRQHAGA